MPRRNIYVDKNTDIKIKLIRSKDPDFNLSSVLRRCINNIDVEKIKKTGNVSYGNQK